MIILLLGLIASYLIGSIPIAYIFGRLFKGVDIREYGSGNVGATNVFRVVGKAPGLIALALDIFKGFLCATYAASFFMTLAPVARPELYRIFAGLAAIAGHNWTIFLKFKGGKGVAASAGVVIGLIPKIFWLGFLVWGIAFSLTGFVSAASIIASIVIPIFALVFGEATEIVIFTSLLCLLIAYKHRPNITRLIKGEEKRISLFRKPR
ncbi:MAG: glycerol-3-phosphate 1-O-acyltransferase PlsY [Candidatus Omnitrophica bacterium]|nr:glycerol-3-phosphate 1-O-acyltransferase PlsY [Candidatus Omnitrophota bacterium]